MDRVVELLHHKSSFYLHQQTCYVENNIRDLVINPRAIFTPKGEVQLNKIHPRQLYSLQFLVFWVHQHMLIGILPVNFCEDPLPSLSNAFRTSFVLEPEDRNSSIFIPEFRLDGTEEDRSTSAKWGAIMSMNTRPDPFGFRAIDNGDVFGFGQGSSSTLKGPIAKPHAHQSVRLILSALIIACLLTTSLYPANWKLSEKPDIHLIDSLSKKEMYHVRVTLQMGNIEYTTNLEI